MLSNKKPLLETFLTPVATVFKHVSPNTLTLIGSIPSILFFVFMINHWYGLALLAFLGLGFDAIDGLVARNYNKVTKFGGVLDSSFDRISDFLVLVAFAFAGIVRWEILAPVLLASFLVSYIRTRGEAANKEVSFAVGVMERSERLFFILLGLIMFIIFPQIIIYGLNLAEVTFLLLLALSFYTIWQRLNHARKYL